MEYLQGESTLATMVVDGDGTIGEGSSPVNGNHEIQRSLLLQQQRELHMQQLQLERQLQELQQKQMLTRQHFQQPQEQQHFAPNQYIPPSNDDEDDDEEEVGDDSDDDVEEQPQDQQEWNGSWFHADSNQRPANVNMYGSLLGTVTKIVDSFNNPSPSLDAFNAFSATPPPSSSLLSSSSFIADDSSYPTMSSSTGRRSFSQYYNNVGYDGADEDDGDNVNAESQPRPIKRKRTTKAVDITPPESPNSDSSSPEKPCATSTGGKKLLLKKKRGGRRSKNQGGGGDVGTGAGAQTVNRFRAYQADQWSTMLEDLLAFKRQFGHCNVPHTSKEFPTLGRWVKRQRYQYKIMMDGKKESTMTPARVKVLERAGFVFDSHGSSWSQRFYELQCFKKEFGHCNVPSPYQSNPALSNWTKFQRRQIKKKLLSQDRIDALEAIGFQWELRKAPSSSRNDDKTVVKSDNDTDIMSSQTQTNEITDAITLTEV